MSQDGEPNPGTRIGNPGRKPSCRAPKQMLDVLSSWPDIELDGVVGLYLVPFPRATVTLINLKYLEESNLG